MRQILADAISKFQKITRQMLCDKCSKNDVTLIPQTSNGGNITLILKMLTSYGREITSSLVFRYMGGIKLLVYFIFDIVSFDISSNCRHFNGSPLLCPINATSTSSYVFRLQYPRVLHCRIVPIEKMKTLVGF